MSPLTPVSQHPSANENRCLCAIAQAPGQHHSWWAASFLYFSLANPLVLMHILACAKMHSKTSPAMGTNLGSDQKVVVSCEQSFWGSKGSVLLCLRQCVLPEVVAAFADILPLAVLPAQSLSRVPYSLILCELLSKYIFCPGKSAAHLPL